MSEARLDATGVIRRMVEAFRTGVAVDCEEFISPSYLDHQGRGGTPLHGPDGFRQVVRAAHRTAAPQVSIADLVTDSQRAAVRLHWVFSSPEEGTRTERETIEIVRVEDGRAVEHWGAESWSRVLPAEEEKGDAGPLEVAPTDN